LDKAVVGTARVGYCRVGVYTDAWETLVKTFESHGIGSCNVTRRRLMLDSTRDSTTGWYTKSYEETTIKMIFAPRSATSMLVSVGVGGLYYEVKTVEPHYLTPNSFWFRSCQLTLIPFHEV